MSTETSAEQTRYLNILEDIASTLKKTQINIKKCPKARLTESYIKSRLKCIEDHWDMFKKTHNNLVGCTPREQKGILPYFLNEEYFIYEDLFLSLKSDLMDWLQGCQRGAVVDNNDSSRTMQYDERGSYVQLPRIQLPCFSGKYEEFPAFQDLFISLVHTSTSLSNVQKLHYLKSSISGEAEALLRHINITESNYVQAWELLKNRYGNKRLIVTSLLKRLFNQKKLGNQTAQQVKSLLDTTVECLQSLRNLEISTDSWDPLIVFLVVQKLDVQTHKEWEENAYQQKLDELPTWAQLQKFLESKFRTLELISPSTSSTRERIHTHTATHEKGHKNNYPKTQNSSLQPSCVFCNGQHYIYNCKEFSKQNIEERRHTVKKNKLCFNCLIPNHNVYQCRQHTTCKICRRRHHTLLHETNKKEEDNVTNTNNNTINKEVENVIASHYSREEEIGQEVLLATALVDVISRSGESHTFRALIDQGSEASFVTSRVVDLLGLKKSRVSGIVTGVGESNKLPVKHVVNLSIHSRYNAASTFPVKAYVLKTISTVPSREFTCNNTHLSRFSLADPNFAKPSKIDILLGADIYAKIIEVGLHRMPDGLIAQQTSLGWILSGKKDTILSSTERRITSLHITRDIKEDNNLLKRFWEIETENYTNKRKLTKEEQTCEEIYSKTTRRDESGRYIVHLPLKQSIEETVKRCGDTKEQAVTRFKYLQKKFEKNPKLEMEYKKVIQEYLDMEHMQRKDTEEDNSIYLPHHAVIREDKDTTKVRVVYDASAKGINGCSLNDTMMVGPVLQPDLRSLIICWRKHKICVVADIMKMYRMVKITEEHANLQCIVWSEGTDKPIETYKLKTVTFGTAAAPYLAVRTLRQLTLDEELAKQHSKATYVINNCFYMDDLMVSLDELEEAKETCDVVERILAKGGFKMQKWTSNNEELLKHLQNGRDDTKDNIEIKLDKVIKILGLSWDRKDDKFKVKVNLPDLKTPVTKRSVLSDVARLFDPFGWLSPVIITAKIMIQKLWLCNLGWDDELPDDLKEEWIEYREGLTCLQDITISRWLKLSPNNIEIQLHGFSDASSTSYAAMVYLKVKNKNKEVYVTLIASRTKVAPIKQLTIPRLELCGAVLLAELINDIAGLIDIPKNKIFAYTDSMVVLAWLQSQPNRWRTFVANRVSDILQILDNDQWSHVQSNENPADIATRGIKACDLKENELWWRGPKWLTNEEIAKEQRVIPKTELELKTICHTHIEEPPIWEKFSSLSRMKRVLAYCKRWKKQNYIQRRSTILTSGEMEEILNSCIRYYQELVYPTEVEDLKKKKGIKKGSSLISLSPFLDANGIMRVGGRLQKALMPEHEKHPIIIPDKVHITRLLINEAHIKTLHGGIQLMMSYIRSRYWVIGLRRAVKKCIRTCKICIIDTAKVKYQLMGQLPLERVRPHRPFLNSGVDFAGPVFIRTSKGRGHHGTKGYICLFVCMSTRAIHLEMVTDLTSQAFIAAFRRFVARRGHCANIWSDNGTNFVGSAKELKQLFENSKKGVINEVAELLSNDGTTWHFIPPRMPSYGGLWESGIRSVKRHLTRVNSGSKLTYEEMSTLLAQIEACLNSRPLCNLDNTAETLTPLTPAHFLVGEPLIGVPDEVHEDRKINLLTRWQLVQKLTQDFWRRWHVEYLNTLQQRHKWQVPVTSPKIGDMVIIKESDMPPTKWLLGKITALHPGPDNLVRVVTVQCKGNKQMKRPVFKLIHLPFDDE